MRGGKRRLTERGGRAAEPLQIFDLMSLTTSKSAGVLDESELGADARSVAAVDPLEVARVERVPLAELLDPANRFRVRHPSGYVGPGFSASGLFVWGFTAGLLSRLLALAGLEQPWDTSRVRPVPDLAVERRT